MFGKKKEITQKFIAKPKEETDQDSSSSPKKDRARNSVQDNADNNFIFYGSDNKFAKQLEIYATLKEYSNIIQDSKNKKLVLTIVDSNSPMEYLSFKIRDSFSQFPEYQDLEGFTAKNLTKMDEEKNLPTEGKVGDFLRNGDIIYLDLVSNEVWIKVNIGMINIMNKNIRLNVTMDVKIKNECNFRELRIKLLKYSIMCFLNKYRKENFHYIISKFTLSHSVHGDIDESRLKSFENMKIKQLFKFKDRMNLEIHFYPLELILFKRLKNIPKPKKEKTGRKKAAWERFKSLRFKDFLSSAGYIKEKLYIFNFFKNLFMDQSFSSNCYLYSVDNDNTTESRDETYDLKYEKKDSENDFTNLNINNIQENENIEYENNLDKNNDFLNNPFNKSKTLDTKFFKKNTITFEENKFSLLIDCPNEEQEQDQDQDDNEERKEKYSSKNVKIYKEFYGNNIINEEDDENENENENEKEKEKEKENDVYVHKFRKKSFKKHRQSKKKFYGTLDFEIINKNDLLEDDDEVIVYKDLKPKKIFKKPTADVKMKFWGMSNKIDLCSDFDKYFDKNKFITFICGLFKIYIKKGSLERSIIPVVRGFKIEEKEIMAANNKKRKKKKSIISISYYGQMFPIKRLNLEIGVFSFFILAIFMFFSYLISYTYY